MVIWAPDRQVRVRAGGGRPLGITHPGLLTPWLGIWNLGGACRADPHEACRFAAHTLAADPATPKAQVNKRRNTAPRFSPLGKCWGWGGGEGPNTGPDNCFHIPCQDSRARGAYVMS